MKEPLVAFDPTALEGKGFENVCEKIRFFQEKGVLSEASVVSVIHSALYATPNQYFNSHKGELKAEARDNIKKECAGRFEFDTVRILESDSALNEDVVEKLVRLAKSIRSDVLVLGSNDRRGLPYWLLGSLSETAALMAAMPILILKLSAPVCRLSQQLRFVMAVDVAAPPTATEISWLAKMAVSTKAHVDLIYVEPRKRALLENLQQRESRDSATRMLQRQGELLGKKGVSVTTKVLPETRSIAQTIAAYTEKHHAWLTIVTTPKRTKARRLLLGSNARHVLTLTKRPFLSLRG